jgi:hypothetical protein
MSMKRLCDCGCHEDDGCYYEPRVIEGENYDVFDGRDICNDCLAGITCKKWIPYVFAGPTQITKLIADIYDPLIEASMKRALTADKLFNQPKKSPRKGQSVTFRIVDERR